MIAGPFAFWNNREQEVAEILFDNSTYLVEHSTQ